MLMAKSLYEDRKNQIRCNLRRLEAQKWCEGLGKLNKHWFPLITFYNTGFNLFATSNLSPMDFIGESVQWTWIRFDESNPFYGRRSSAKVINGVSINNFGHDDANRSVKIGITYDQMYYEVINPCQILHMVETISGPELYLENRPLPMAFFSKAFQRV